MDIYQCQYVYTILVCVHQSIPSGCFIWKHAPQVMNLLRSVNSLNNNVYINIIIESIGDMIIYANSVNVIA